MVGIQLSTFFSLFTGNRYMVICVCILWGILGYAENSDTDVRLGLKQNFYHGARGGQVRVWKNINLELGGHV